MIMLPDMAFDYPSLCLPAKDEGRNPHLSTLLGQDRVLVKMKMMAGRGNPTA
jgi:hypothetical protein